MSNVIKIEARRFPVTIKELATGIVGMDEITLTKEQLQAAQITLQSSKELITRMYERDGFEVLEIGKPERRTLEIDVGFLWDTLDFVRECEGGVN